MVQPHEKRVLMKVSEVQSKMLHVSVSKQEEYKE